MKHLCAMPDDSHFLDARADKKTRAIVQENNRYLKSVARHEKARCFVRGINVDRAAHERGLISENANWMSHDTSKASNNVFSKVWLDLEKITVISNRGHDF